MNFQQLTNLSILSQFVSDPWRIVINIDVAIVAWILYYLIKAIAGTKIMILVRRVLFFILAQFLPIYQTDHYSWLISRSHHLQGHCGRGDFLAGWAGLERLGRATDIFLQRPSVTKKKMVQAFVKSIAYEVRGKSGLWWPIQGNRTLQGTLQQGFPWMQMCPEAVNQHFIPNTPFTMEQSL